MRVGGHVTTEVPIEGLAHPLRRLLARFLDMLIVILLGLIVLPFFDVSADNADSLRRGPAFFALLITWGVYEVGLTAWRGMTIGKMAARIRVVDASSRRPPSLLVSAIRWMVPAAAGLIPYLGIIGWVVVYMWLLGDRRRQGLHDKVAGTLVVNE